MRAKPQTIDEYLAPLSDEERAALEKLRKAYRGRTWGNLRQQGGVSDGS